MTGGPVAVILAAGSGERFGSTKLLAPLRSRPLVAHAVATAVEAGFDDIVLVVGHDGDRVATAATAASGLATLHTVSNPDYPSGQASSLRWGVEAAQALEPSVVVVLLGDQPGVDAEVVGRVRERVLSGAEVARAAYRDGAGHPVAFHPEVLPRLLEVTGDEGARQVLDGLDVTEVEVDGPTPADVDTPEDLDALQRGG